MSTAPPSASDPRGTSGWSRISRDVAMVLWPSFLAAAVESMFFFAVFDPVQLGDGTALAALIDNHNAGYALGFFFFWAFTTLSSALTLYLARTERGANAGPDSERT
jgi:hypothetical protein